MAASSPAPPRTVQFGRFELDLAPAELRKEGAVESLPPQPLRVLVLLVSRAGDLVTGKPFDRNFGARMSALTLTTG